MQIDPTITGLNPLLNSQLLGLSANTLIANNLVSNAFNPTAYSVSSGFQPGLMPNHGLSRVVGGQTYFPGALNLIPAKQFGTASLPVAKFATDGASFWTKNTPQTRTVPVATDIQLDAAKTLLNSGIQATKITAPVPAPAVTMVKSATLAPSSKLSGHQKALKIDSLKSKSEAPSVSESAPNTKSSIQATSAEQAALNEAMAEVPHLSDERAASATTPVLISSQGATTKSLSSEQTSSENQAVIDDSLTTDPTALASSLIALSFEAPFEVDAAPTLSIQAKIAQKSISASLGLQAQTLSVKESLFALSQIVLKAGDPLEAAQIQKLEIAFESLGLTRQFQSLINQSSDGNKTPAVISKRKLMAFIVAELIEKDGAIDLALAKASIANTLSFAPSTDWTLLRHVLSRPAQWTEWEVDSSEDLSDQLNVVSAKSAASNNDSFGGQGKMTN